MTNFEEVIEDKAEQWGKDLSLGSYSIGLESFLAGANAAKELLMGDIKESDKEVHSELCAEIIKLRTALEFYADKNNWKDVWKEEGKESKDFKYHYQLRQRTQDFEAIGEQYHFYAGKRARSALRNGENK